MKKFILFTLFILTAMVSMAQDDKPKEIKLTPSELELVTSNNNFAFNLFRTARDEKSQVLSPLSITYVLSLLKNGVVGESKNEINNVLGFTAASDKDVNTLCQKLVEGMRTLDEQTQVICSNGIFVNKGYQVKETFADMASQYYDVVPETRDFFDFSTLDYINQWASDHTEEMIQQVLDEEEYNPLAISYLLNALYFKGEWTHHFDKAETRPMDFDGGKMTADMMYQESNFYYTENDLYQSIVLPYGNQSYRMVVFLPRKGNTLDDVLAQMNGENWSSTSYSAAHVKLSFPRFETDTDMRLNDIMAALGMPRIFAYDEITEFCDAALHIGLMKQAAKIRVDEDGTEAAAVTVVETRKSLDEVTFNANHPFLYVISEQSTGAILFIGQYCGETTAHKTNPSIVTRNLPGIYNLSGKKLESEPSNGIYIKDGKKRKIVK